MQPLKIELKEFLTAYEIAANSKDWSQVKQFIDNKATFLFTDGSHKGITSIKKAFLDTWNKIVDDVYSISNIKWIYVSDNVAVCTYEFSSTGMVNDKKQTSKGKGTSIIKKDNSKWKIIYEHLSR